MADTRSQAREQRQDRALSAARQKIGAQVDDLEERLAHLRVEEQKYLKQALAARKKGEKQFALSSMKLLTKVRKDIAVVDTALHSAERDLSEIDHTTVVRDVVASKREVRKAVGSAKLGHLATETENLVDDSLDAAEQLESIEATLTEVVASMGSGDDDASLMAELDAIEDAELDRQLAAVPEAPQEMFHDTAGFDAAHVAVAVAVAPQPEPEPEPQPEPEPEPEPAEEIAPSSDDEQVEIQAAQPLLAT